MVPQKDDIIDINKLTQRELLILLRQDVQGLKEGLSALQKDKVGQAVEIAKLKERVGQKSAFWGAVSGTITAAVTAATAIIIKSS